MKSTFKFAFAVSLVLCVATFAADKKLTKEQLPAAVQKTADEQSKGGTVTGYSSEVENGKTEYEVRLKANGHQKSVSIDATGKVLEVEEQVDMASLTDAVKAGLKKAAGKGTLGKVETLTKDGKLVAYEAKVTTGTKKSEVQVGPNGEKLDHEE